MKRNKIKTLIYILAISAPANGAWYDIFVDFFKSQFAKVQDGYQDFLIENRAPEKLIKKKLPDDWVPSE